MTRPRVAAANRGLVRDLPESSRMPPSATEGLANQVITIADARGCRERMRELEFGVVRVHEGAHSRRDNAAVKHRVQKMSGPDPLARLARRNAVGGEPRVNALGRRGIDPRLAMDVERGHAVAAEDLHLGI